MSGGAKKLLHAAAGTAASGDPVYVEDVFSTFLYDGVNSANTITNGIDLDEEGGLVWCKDRNYANPHRLYDTDRGINKYLESSDSAAEGTNTGSGTNHGIDQFNSNGFRIGGQDGAINDASSKYVSWSFRKQTGFFDIVKWTGTGANLTVSHNLGCVPGMIAIKNTGGVHQWVVYHVGTDASNPATKFLVLNDNDAAANANLSKFQQTAPTATNFYVGSNADCNENGETMIAYLFAGTGDSASQIFGDGGDEAIIKTGVFEGAANTTVNLGFEPQWIMFKNTTSASNWQIIDNMRGMPSLQNDQQLMANNNNAESANGLTTITSTGFTWLPSAASNHYIYTAIRRGPMKEPSAGTDVFAVDKANTGTMPPTYHSNFPVDLQMEYNSGESAAYRTKDTYSRLGGHYLEMNTTDAALTGASSYVSRFAYMNGATDGSSTIATKFSYMWRRYPKVFDVVVYTGAGAGTHTHNLAAVPELMIIKCTSHSNRWIVYSAALGNTKQLHLDEDIAETTGQFNNTTPTASVFSVSDNTQSGTSGRTYVALLFASLSGISKIGTYTGTGNDLNVTDLGAAARFVLIKRTDATGDWYVFDSLRGIVDGNEDTFLLNTDDALISGNDYIDSHSSGFTITSSAPAALNASGGTYIYLAFA